MTETVTPYEMLTRWKADGTVSGATIRRLHSDGSRVWESDPIPLADAADDPAFATFAEQFAAAAVAERDELAATNVTLTAQVVTLTDEKAAVQAELDALKATLVPTATRIWPREFLRRFTNEEIVAIQLSVDPGVILARTHLQTAVSLIDLTLQETQQLVGLLVLAGIIDSGRAAEVLT